MAIIVEVLDSVLAAVALNPERPGYRLLKMLGLVRAAEWLSANSKRKSRN